MNNPRKCILDKFEEYLQEGYGEYCKRHNIEQSISGLITYVIDQDLICLRNVKQFTILKEFEILYPQHKHHKTQTVIELAHRFNISERSVWGVLKKKE